MNITALIAIRAFASTCDDMAAKLEGYHDELTRQFDNMSESAQESDWGEKLTTEIETLREAYERLDRVGSMLSKVTGP